MPSQKNVHALAEINHLLEESKAIIFADYSGLSVADQTALRQKIAESKGDYVVTKNNLLRLAFKNKLNEIPKEIDAVLNGQTAIIVAKEDAVSSTKALVEFAKDKNLPTIKIGFMEGKVLSVSQIDYLSKLPGKNQLLAQLLAQLQAPITSFVRQINAPAQRLVYALEAIRNK